jgi:hypothetical protein
MEEIVARVPSTLNDLSSVHGIGPTKLASIGKDVIALVRAHS